MQARKYVAPLKAGLVTHALAVLILFSLASAGSAWEAKGFKTPESVLTDPATGYIYVSNINGAPTAKDDNGFISRLDPEGSVQNLKFIDGRDTTFTLNAPKGMAIHNGLLYVTDITYVRAFSLKDAANIANIDLGPLGASFVNDLTVDEKGDLYASDTASNTIFLIQTRAGNEARVLIKHDGLQGPNGLMIHPQTGNIIVASWGAGLLLEITAESIEQLDAGGPFRNLDGIDYDKAGNIYFSDFSAGVVYKLEPRGTQGKAVPIAEKLKSPADISVDREKAILLIPEFTGHRVKSIPLE